MMKHARKLIALLLVFVMAAGLLAGCGGDSAGGGDGSGATGSKKLVIKFFKGGYGEEYGRRK